MKPRFGTFPDKLLIPPFAKSLSFFAVRLRLCINALLKKKKNAVPCGDLDAAAVGASSFLTTQEVPFRSVSQKTDVQTSDSVPADFVFPQDSLNPLTTRPFADEAQAVAADQILAILSSGTHPHGMKATEIAERTGADKKTRHRVRRLLSELLETGQIERGPAKRYFVAGAMSATITDGTPQTAQAVSPAEKPSVFATQTATARATPAEAAHNAVVGRILLHAGGFGFVHRDDGGDNVYVAARHRGAAMDRDRVALKTWQTGRGPEGRVVTILERGRARLTGTVEWTDQTAVLRPDDPRISGRVFLVGDIPWQVAGQSVVVEILEYPELQRQPWKARLLAVLGAPDDPRTEIAKILTCEEVDEVFPDDVLAEAIPEAVTDQDLSDRVDLRALPFVTIDPETARDFDDAICVEPAETPGNLRLWVAVADVSHYVRPGTATDREAIRRGVSVYLPDRVVPMLPLPLSSGICSLNPQVQRLAMVARLEINPAGDVVDRQLMAAVILSCARFHYEAVGRALWGTPLAKDCVGSEHLPQLQLLAEVSRRLRLARERRGGLDFDLPEAKVVLADDDPRLIVTVKRSRADATVRRAYQMVEDAMLAANEAVADFFAERTLDALWRVHAPPRREPLERLAELAKSFGIAFDPDSAQKPAKLREFLLQFQGQPKALSYLLLRSLQQAIYSVENIGHFGLAAPRYLHFTSPIRRYPDLVTHRLLKLVLRREKQSAGQVFGKWPLPQEMKQWAADSSLRERRSMEVERQVVDFYRAQLMREHLGEEFSGTISSITTAGLFVELDDPYVEGLVRSERLDDEFELCDKRLSYRSSRTGVSLGLGDRVTVRIESVSIPQRRIELSLVWFEQAKPKRARKTDKTRASHK